MKRDLVLVDGGGTNIGSLRYAFARLGIDAPLVTDAARIRSASHVVLPGVGAAGPAMQRLHDLQLVDTLRGLTQPVLGVCLGMQLLFAASSEAQVECLGIIPAHVHKLCATAGERVPHMGWNRLDVQHASPLLAGVGEDAYAYFVHSFAAPIGAWTLASTAYAGGFSSIVNKDNYYGMQFHPERSAAVGSRLLSNFLSL